MKRTTIKSPRAKTTSLPSLASYSLFGDVELSSLLAVLESEVARFVDAAGNASLETAVNMGCAKRLLEVLTPLLNTFSKGGCNADQLFPLIELATEAVARPLMKSPRSEAQRLRRQRDAEVLRIQTDQGGWNKGNCALAPHDDRIRELFQECHGGGPKPLIRGWRKKMLEKLELDHIVTDPDRLTARLKTLELLPADRKR